MSDLRKPPAWTQEAPCAQTDPALFFPEIGTPRTGKQVCADCAVRTPCLEWALSFERNHPSMTFGIYGGLSAGERRRLIRGEAASA